MNYKSFQVGVVIRVILLVISISLLAWMFLQPHFIFNQITLCLMLIAQVTELIRFVNTTNRELSRFLLGIRHSDFSMNLRQSQHGASFRELEDSMMMILDAYKQVKIEKEAQYHFLQLLVNQLPMGIIAVANHEIVLMNTASEKILNLPGTRNWTLIKTHHPNLQQELEWLGDRGRKVIELRNNLQTIQLALEVNTSIILEHSYRIITLQDINTEMEQKELEAWHKLIRILTHEIMNSVTPIASLTETTQTLLSAPGGQPKAKEDITTDIIQDVHFSLKTIHKRSEGLLSFVDSYRKLTRVPKPNLRQIILSDFLHAIVHLTEPDLRSEQIHIHVEVKDPALTALIDPVLAEQVLLNLISNSSHALQSIPDKQIILRGYQREHFIVIEVEDNGKGIPDKEMREIFIPFFSTRKEGSGIGLSLSKQIMSLHHGTIHAVSPAGRGAIFFLKFPVR
jgi:nitrogen fixation/metabolism regulation signal transduction histidine kinase